MSRKWHVFIPVVMGILPLIVFVALVSPAFQAKAQPAPIAAAYNSPIYNSQSISKAVGYLQSKQLPNGGIEGWVVGQADEFTTIKTVQALAAAGRPLQALTSVSGTTPLDYLAARAITYTHAETGTGQLFPGRAGMLAVAVAAGEGDPYSFGGMNIIHELTNTYHPATGAYSTTAVQGWTSGAAGAINQVWSILSLAAVQVAVPVSATDFLIGLQEGDGGWGYGFGGDVDTTALVLQALLASGNVEPTHIKAQEGLTFLRSQQAASGGWQAWGSLSPDSTAVAIQAIAAAGYTPVAASWAAASGRAPHDDLLGLQAADGSLDGNALSTAHAILGLAEAPLPILARLPRAKLALSWMNSQQNADGSWSSLGSPHPGATCDAALAFAAAGLDPATVMATGSALSPMDYLSATAQSFVTKTADSAGKLAMVVAAAGQDPRNFGGVNIIHTLTNTWYSPTLGAFGVPTNTWHQAFAILGMAAAGEPVHVSATQTLLGLQQPDGGWSYDLGYVWTTPDDTGLAMQALIAAGVPPTHTSLISATAFLRAQQDQDGGWGNANSTAFAVQGLLAAGENLPDWQKNGHTPYAALAAYQKPDGPFVYMWDSPWGKPTDDFFATRQAVPALLGRYTPFTPTAALSTFTAVSRGADPDRILAVAPRVAWGNSVKVLVPFGSDLDMDASVELDWRALGQTAWIAAALSRGEGVFTATLPLTRPLTYEFRATLTDVDGVQYGAALTNSVMLTTTLKPYSVHLPLVVK